MEDIHVHAGEVGVLASGAGHAAWNNVSVVASIKGVSVQTPTSSLGDLHIELTSNEAVGIAVLGGQHDWADIVVEKPFVSADQSSVGFGRLVQRCFLGRIYLSKPFNRHAP